MTIEGVLFILVQVMLLLNWPVTIILARAARIRPRIRVLTTMAVLSCLISVCLTIYVWAVLNSVFGFPISREVGQAILRMGLIGLGIFPIWFLWLYLTGRFRDGSN